MKIGKINIYDYIGEDGITARDFIAILEQLESEGVEKFEVRINSKGGDIFEGFAIYNALKERDVIIYIDGLAASIASVIAMAGKTIYIYQNSFLMIHNPWTIAIGDNNDIEKVSDDLKKFRDAIINIYKEKTGMDEDELKNLMDKTTFFTADDAVKYKFADEIVEKSEAKNYVALFTEVYDDHKSQKKDTKMNKKLLAFLGFSNEEIEKGIKDEQIEAKLTELRAELGADENATVAEIVTLMKDAEPQGSANSNELNELKDQVATLTAKLDEYVNKGAEEELEAKARELVEDAIKNFKILASQKEAYMRSAVADFDATKAELEAIPKDAVKNAKLNVGGDLDTQDSAAVADAINKYRAEKAKLGINVSYAEAAKAVTGK